jgi:hypothetical protein
MPLSTRLVKRARFAPVISWGVGLLVVAGCGPPELGSIQLPENLKRSGPMVHGPAASNKTAPSLGPGDFRPASLARAKKSQRTGRLTGPKPR